MEDGHVFPLEGNCGGEGKYEELKQDTRELWHLGQISLTPLSVLQKS